MRHVHASPVDMLQCVRPRTAVSACQARGRIERVDRHIRIVEGQRELVLQSAATAVEGVDREGCFLLFFALFAFGVPPLIVEER